MTLARKVLSMRATETVHAEPCDSIDSPAYRVNFWQRPSPEHAWNLDAYVLTDVEDITELLQWVNEHAAGRRFEVFVETNEEPERSFQSSQTTGLIRLLGSNPSAGETVEIVRLDKLYLLAIQVLRCPRDVPLWGRDSLCRVADLTVRAQRVVSETGSRRSGSRPRCAATLSFYNDSASRP